MKPILFGGRSRGDKVAGRQIEFTVRATEAAREIGVGTHARVVVDVGKFTERLAEEESGRE
jgi:predicted thioesterase